MPQRIIKKIHHYTLPHEANEYKPHSLRHKSLAFYSVLVLVIKLAVGFSFFAIYPSAAEFSTITTKRIVELTNKVRTEYNLESLEMSETLNQAAALKLADMLAGGYFAHHSPSGVTPWHWFGEVDYNYTFAGENLAMNFVEAEDTVQAWMDSPSHRDNIISKNYDEIGVAVGIGEIDGYETTVVVQLFGKRYFKVAGQEVFKPVASQVETPAAREQTAEVEINKKAEQQEVTLEKSKSGWLFSLAKYGTKFFCIFLILIVINLLLTIFIRLEIQHKPIIFHSLLVIILTTLMILWKIHFMEGLGEVMVV